jgi:hypothetical protein
MQYCLANRSLHCRRSAEPAPESLHHDVVAFFRYSISFFCHRTALALPLSLNYSYSNILLLPLGNGSWRGWGGATNISWLKFICTFWHKTQWSQSASKLYRPSDRRLSAKLVPTFADRGCRVVSATDLHVRILGFVDQTSWHSLVKVPCGGRLGYHRASCTSKRVPGV